LSQRLHGSGASSPSLIHTGAMTFLSPKRPMIAGLWRCCVPRQVGRAGRIDRLHPELEADEARFHRIVGGRFGIKMAGTSPAMTLEIQNQKNGRAFGPAIRNVGAARAL
jgi:hypothetical protein